MASAISNKIHFDLAMSQSANNEIETIAKAKGLEPGEVLSRAISLFIELQKARKPGDTVGLLDAEKKPVAEFIDF